MLNLLAIPTMMVYYNKGKIPLAEPYLRSNIVPYAKRTQKSSNYRRRKEPYPLWGDHSYLLVLQKTQAQVAFAKKSSFPSTLQPLPSCRVNFSHYLCSNRWRSPFRQNQDSSRQWRFPTDYWIKILPLLKQSKTLSKTNQHQNHSEYQQGSRPFKVKDVLSTTISHQLPFRFRFNGSDHLWQIHRHMVQITSDFSMLFFRNIPHLLCVTAVISRSY